MNPLTCRSSESPRDPGDTALVPIKALASETSPVPGRTVLGSNPVFAKPRHHGHYTAVSDTNTSAPYAQAEFGGHGATFSLTVYNTVRGGRLVLRGPMRRTVRRHCSRIRRGSPKGWEP